MQEYNKQQLRRNTLTITSDKKIQGKQEILGLSDEMDQSKSGMNQSTRGLTQNMSQTVLSNVPKLANGTTVKGQTS